jgi:hypothetical protein
MIDMEVVVLGDKVTAVPILSEPHARMMRRRKNRRFFSFLFY